MYADAAGITVCLFAFSLLSFERQGEVYSRHFHWLRDFALGHVEAAEIFAAID
jgi:Antirestriction protein